MPPPNATLRPKSGTHEPLSEICYKTLPPLPAVTMSGHERVRLRLKELILTQTYLFSEPSVSVEHAN